MTIIPMYTTLSNHVQMPRVGFGTWQLKGEFSFDSVLFALQEGYQLIDTASIYGNEIEVGKAIRTYKEERSSNQEEIKSIFLTSKANTKEIVSYDATYTAYLNSLERLGVEKLDLYLLHFPGSYGVDSQSEVNRTNRREAWMAMEKLYNEGRVRAIGVSNYMVNHLNNLIKDGINIYPMVDQIEYHPLCQNEELLQWASDHNMILQAYSSLGIGSTELLNNEIALKVGQEVKRTPAQILLRWGLQKNLCILPRSKTRSRISENFRLFDFNLNKEQMSELSNLKNFQRFCWDPTVIA